MEHIPMTFRDSGQAFADAIAKGRLVDHPNGVDPYAGDYMYMGTAYGIDLFKHIDTRQYLRPSLLDVHPV